MTLEGATGTDLSPPDAAGPDRATFLDVMASVPTGVTILTTTDEHGTPYGMTASSFCSVSLDPPLVLVCVATSASCFPAFIRCGRFAVSVLRPEHAALARRFASRSAEKFAAGGLRPATSGLPVVDGALATLECRVYDRHLAGDHVILVGEVRRARWAGGTPLVYAGRVFTELAS
ncbi:flavin reductase ActVB [Krasilnikovia cinnamomea]|uniref:Flavin reductase ActVB n=1 Tax=Krasilnikovia cinnamomea TaxID=349313 RepID=A0A4Q7ZMI0_9ACTN|nr:flavin reductase family protein [Krasilnikovia cinnamomea]RZU51623.1 flavin reductase ActVB [Krasilnikovia cinnamomea]